MKIFIMLLAGLAVASAIAWGIKPGPDPLGRTRLVWVSDDNPARQATLKLFEKMNPQYVVTFDPVYKAGMEKVIVQSTGGVGPDIFDCYGNYQLASFVQADVAWDVTDELAKAGIDVKKDCWPAIYGTAIYQGRTYGFPANVASDVLFFDKDAFDREGVPYPKGPMTWAQFIPIAQRMTLKDSEGHVTRYGFSFDFNRWRDFLPQFGAKLYTDDGTRCTLDSPEAIAAANFEHDLIWKYRIMPTAAEEDASVQQGGYGNIALKFLAMHRAASVLGGRWWLTSMRQYTGLNTGACEAPHGPVYCFAAYGKSTVINKHSPRREQALQFLLFMHTKEYNDLINQLADGMAPMPKYCTMQSLVNPEFPNEDFHAVFPETMKHGVLEQISPFVNTALAVRLMDAQHDLIRRNAKTPEEGMREMARQVNEEIQKALARDPELKKRYDALMKNH